MLLPVMFTHSTVCVLSMTLFKSRHFLYHDLKLTVVFYFQWFAGLHNYVHWQLCFCFTLDYKLKSLVILHSVHHSAFVCLCMFLKWGVLAVCSWSSKICVCLKKNINNSGNICQDLNNAHIFFLWFIHVAAESLFYCFSFYFCFKCHGCSSDHVKSNM